MTSIPIHTGQAICVNVHFKESAEIEVYSASANWHLFESVNHAKDCGQNDRDDNTLQDSCKPIVGKARSSCKVK
jgi:hypothetical protein